MQQAEGHPDVVPKSRQDGEGGVVAKVPSEQSAMEIISHDAYVRVRWGQADGYARVTHLVPAEVKDMRDAPILPPEK